MHINHITLHRYLKSKSQSPRIAKSKNGTMFGKKYGDAKNANSHVVIP